MAIVRQSLHRWWVVLTVLVGSMLAIADVSSCEMMGKVRPAVASGAGGFPDALSDDAQDPDKSRLVTADRSMIPAAAPICSGSCACRARPRIAPASRTGAPVPKSRSERAAMAVPDGSGSPVPMAPLRGGSTRRSHKRAHAVPKAVPSNDPNDDTTSGEPDEDDDDETSKSLNGSDDTDATIRAGLEERVPGVIPRECAPVTRTAPPSSSLLTLQQLRC
jgi:hypothetical protein